MIKAALLQLMRLVSPALPIGAFAYSQGLEYALDADWVKDDKELQSWLEGVLKESIGKTDVPVIFRFYKALEQKDPAQLAYWNQWLRANRESQELLFEEEQLGLALKRLLTSEKMLGELELPDNPGYSCLFAIAAYQNQVPAEDAALGFAWSWLENQIAAACKTMPLGQTAAQHLISNLMPALEQTVAIAAHLDDDELGSTLPGFSLASALHESQYSRLFRS